MKTKTKEEEDFILLEARGIMLSRLRKPGGIIANVDAVQQYLVHEYGLLEAEQFGCMFLDKSYGLINHLKLFRGTTSHCTTYPREIAREALLQNAVFVILVHNHPAHNTVPSKEDVEMTLAIRKVLEVVDIVLFDHIVVAGASSFSMRGAGYLS